MRAGPGLNVDAGIVRDRTGSAVTARPFAGARGAAVVWGLLVAGGLAAVGTLVSPHNAVITTVVIAPFAVSLFAGWRETMVVAGVALALAMLSGVWTDNLDMAAYQLRSAVVFAGGAFAVVAAGARERTARDRLRFALLADVAGISDGRLTLEETANRLIELVVPVFADAGIVDVVHGGGLRRLAVRASAPDAAAHEAKLMSEPPREAEHSGPGSIGVPLTARGRSLGALTLTLNDRSQRRYTADDTGFARLLASRIALALDNAGLFTELETMEAQLTTALGTLAEAVTVQSAQGNLIYANQAAASLLGFASPRELLATPAGDIVARYASFREDGSPLRVEDLPGRRVLGGEEPEALVLRVVDRRTGEQRWRRTKSTAVRGTGGELRMIVNVIADITAVKRAELLQRLLGDAGEALASTEDLHQILQHIAGICVPELADWCMVGMPGEHHRLVTVAVAHADPEKLALAERLTDRYQVDLDGSSGTAQVFREGRPLVVNQVSDEVLTHAARANEHLAVLGELGMHARLTVPLTTHGATVGVLTLVNAASGRVFSDEDVALASELARQAATAVENARLYTERSRIARTLQESLLPEKLPALPGYRTASLYRPAGDEDRVGGDFYEAFALNDTARMLVVGDVTGRGTTAAALTGLMRHTLRAIATFTGSAMRALHRLNDELTARPETSLCTAVCVILRETPGAARADIICAGHPLPLLVRDGVATYVGEFGPMLGAFTDVHWRPLTLPLQAGDILVLYSDGVLDATGAADRFGPERLQDALAGAACAQDAVARVRQALAGFEVGPQADDTAVLAIERLVVPDPRVTARATA
ncbi:MAG TPA: SpoIIE family protein phosphatase [Solirubrobacteraceae bacterium]|nr:SpoIIE family protein phosphatase [Solirubrobacteraceae bacterium]